MPDDVGAVFAAMPDAVGACLRNVRAAIFAVAARDADIGALTETLKWGEPAYLTQATRSGSTIRLGQSRKTAGRCAIFVNCNTTLADTVRTRFPELEVEGDRAVLIDPDRPLPEAVAPVLSLALRYHLDKRVGAA